MSKSLRVQILWCVVGLTVAAMEARFPEHVAATVGLFQPVPPQTFRFTQAPDVPSKLHWHLRALLHETVKLGSAGAAGIGPRLSALSNRLRRVKNDGTVQVYIDLTSTGAGELAVLQANGAVVELTHEKLQIVQAWVPVDRLERLADLPFVRAVRTPDYGLPRVGRVTTEGDAILRANELRARGLDGTNVRVGVISDGNDGLAASQATGDLPANVTVVTFPGKGAEGTAMLEIVHDLAPGAQLGFCGPATDLEMVRCIEDLASKFKADIIVDDLGFYAQPYFEDGPIAQEVIRVLATGILYTTAAGNDALNHHESNFIASSNSCTFNGNPCEGHDFGLGAGESTSDGFWRITVNANSEIGIFLQWNDPFTTPVNDYRLLTCDATCSPASLQFIPPASGISGNAVALTNTSAQPQVFNIAVIKVKGANVHVELFALGVSHGQGPPPNHLVPGDSIFGHAAVPGVLAAAAMNAHNPALPIEPISSRGPSTIFFPTFVQRLKPDVTATDGVSITGAGGFSTPFFGTSAAAPHVAGIAALLKSRSPGATAMQIANALQNNAVPRGLHTDFGSGQVDAMAAANQLPFGVTVSLAGSGTGTVASNPPGITCGGTCSAAFAPGTSVTLTATAVSGSMFAGWSGGNCSGTGSCTVHDGATVTATFTLTTSGGSGTPPSSGGGGGCTLARTGSGDSMFAALFLSSLVVFGWSALRRRK